MADLWGDFLEILHFICKQVPPSNPMPKCNVKGSSGILNEERIQRKGPVSTWCCSGEWQRVPEGQQWLMFFIAMANLLWRVKSWAFRKYRKQVSFIWQELCLLKINGRASNKFSHWPAFDLISFSRYWGGGNPEAVLDGLSLQRPSFHFIFGSGFPQFSLVL